MVQVDKDKLQSWLKRRIATLAGCDEWWADDFPAGQMAMLREIEDLVGENYFATIEGIDD